MVCASLPLIAAPAFAAKPDKNPPPAEEPPPPAVADIVFKSVETATGYVSSIATLDIAVPADAVVGDFLIAQIGYNTDGSIAPPAGWNIISVINHPTKPIMQGLFWRAVTDSEPAQYSFLLKSEKADTVAGAIAAYSGVDLDNPIDAFGGQDNPASYPVVAPSITTTQANTTLLGFFTARSIGDFAVPLDMTERWDFYSATGVGAIGETAIEAAEQALTQAGETGSRFATPPASDGSIGHLVALRPAPETVTDPTTEESFVQWEDAAVALDGVSPGQYSGSMSWITDNITNADVFWRAGYDGTGIDIALIDTGVVPVDGLTYPGKVINGVDLSFESQSDELRHLDTFGHGTHLAGIIAGRDNAGGSTFSGMAPGARLVNVKVADSQGAVDVSQVIAALDWVVQHRYDNGMDIRVITLAYGTDSVQPYEIDPLAYAVEQAWKAGIVVVVAAGNDGNEALLRDPAIDPFVIAVGAAENDSTHVSGVASFSNCGSAERSVDIVAPGRSVLSLRSSGSYIDYHHPEAAVDGTYFLGSGTSQAAAVVAGGAALLIDKYPDLTPDQVKSMLLTKADYISGASDMCQGAGSLDMSGLTKLRVPSAKNAEQKFQTSDGSGSLEAARGSNHVSHDGYMLVGEIDIMATPWTGYCDEGGTCVDTLWDGGDFNGVTWSGLSWSGLSWSGLSWSGLSWSGLSWSGLSWSGLSWSGVSWSGLSWSGLSWSGLSWSGLSWSGDTWAGVSWDNPRPRIN
jgi:serine protease AprX